MRLISNDLLDKYEWIVYFHWFKLKKRLIFYEKKNNNLRPTEWRTHEYMTKGTTWTARPDYVVFRNVAKLKRSRHTYRVWSRMKKTGVGVSLSLLGAAWRSVVFSNSIYIKIFFFYIKTCQEIFRNFLKDIYGACILNFIINNLFFKSQFTQGNFTCAILELMVEKSEGNRAGNRLAHTPISLCTLIRNLMK